MYLVMWKHFFTWDIPLMICNLFCIVLWVGIEFLPFPIKLWVLSKFHLGFTKAYKFIFRSGFYLEIVQMIHKCPLTTGQIIHKCPPLVSFFYSDLFMPFSDLLCFWCLFLFMGSKLIYWYIQFKPWCTLFIENLINSQAYKDDDDMIMMIMEDDVSDFVW